jgi:hypothetical protein
MYFNCCSHVPIIYLIPLPSLILVCLYIRIKCNKYINIGQVTVISLVSYLSIVSTNTYHPNFIRHAV